MDLMSMSEREYWANVAKRPGMFVGQVTVARLESFLGGYDAHAQRHGGPGLDGWREWLVARRGRECNHAWPGLVRHLALPDGWHHWQLSPEQEERVMAVLFALLDDFLAEREAGIHTV
ncbi:hypothetical protein [Streptomyces sp. RP5T]|uniref:hypothetical protein n=1 Tax=Streptomyces sp. RP5T TaxID=2490848 RepID=UPI000F64D27D|nr:hypothetical protein [Streptomyces sp. RP5T]RRR70217.1 hypothetical protein EHS43_41230 [Streptomyces sp. RP5T]